MLLDLGRQVAQIQRRLEARSVYPITRTVGEVVSDYLAGPELRGFWSFASVDQSGAIADLSGWGRTLTNNGATPRQLFADFMPYADLDGSNQWFNRATEAGMEITGALTLGGYFWYDAFTANANGMLSKWNGGINQRSYRLFANNSSQATFEVSSNGTAITTVTGPVLLVNTWYQIYGVYLPSTSLSVIVNRAKTTNVTSIPASIFNSSVDFEIGTRDSGGGGLLNGRAALAGVYADDHPDQNIFSRYDGSRSVFGV